MNNTEFEQEIFEMLWPNKKTAIELGQAPTSNESKKPPQYLPPPNQQSLPSPEVSEVSAPVDPNQPPITRGVIDKAIQLGLMGAGGLAALPKILSGIESKQKFDTLEV